MVIGYHESNSGWYLVAIIGFIVLVVVIVYIVYQIIYTKKGKEGIRKLQQVILLDVQNDINSNNIKSNDNVNPEQEGVRNEHNP